MADYLYINSTGTIIPDTGIILTGVQDEYLAAFGSELLLDPETPQGLLINAEVLARTEVVRNNAALANQINPNINGGVYLDAVCALTALFRDLGRFSVIGGVILSGVIDTIISAGSTATTNDGSTLQWQLLSTVQIGPAGTAIGVFRCTTVGPNPAAINTLTIITNGPIGWETVINPAAAILGSIQQSDEALRLQRRNTLALQGSSLALAITAELYKTPGVNSLKFRENVTGSTLVIDGVTLVGHSLYTCVSGGSDYAVGQGILSKKSGGCNYNNGPGINVTINILEPASGQIFPITFDRPNLIQILIKATIAIIGASGDPVDAVKQAILDYTNGLIDGLQGFIVGGDVSCFELATAVQISVPGIAVVNMQTSLISPVDYTNNLIPIAIFQQAFTDEGSITVVTS